MDDEGAVVLLSDCVLRGVLISKCSVLDDGVTGCGCGCCGLGGFMLSKSVNVMVVFIVGGGAFQRRRGGSKCNVGSGAVTVGGNADDCNEALGAKSTATSMRLDEDKLG